MWYVTTLEHCVTVAMSPAGSATETAPRNVRGTTPETAVFKNCKLYKFILEIINKFSTSFLKFGSHDPPTWELDVVIVIDKLLPVHYVMYSLGIEALLYLD